VWFLLRSDGVRTVHTRSTDEGGDLPAADNNNAEYALLFYNMVANLRLPRCRLCCSLSRRPRRAGGMSHDGLTATVLCKNF
jgi:hypothetical protein